VTEAERSFECMGSTMRLVVAGAGAEEAAEAAEATLRDLDRRLSRFRPDSDLCRLNADPRRAVPASAALRDAVRAGRWAAERTGGLVDPTLTGALEAAGYAASRSGVAPASLADALRVAPPRRPARPHPAATWQRVEVDDDEAVIIRPPGVRLDTGGVGKGLAADLVAGQLRGLERCAVDCGGDVRVSGTDAPRRPFAVDVLHPLTHEVVHTTTLGTGGIATSGLDVRLWRRDGGDYAHHLLDPATGRPAWTGLIGATAIGATALEAETLAKAALLSGPAGARRVLARTGGLIVHDDGDVELAGPLRRPRIRVPAQLLDRHRSAA
jgi:FAD:protein FMN transferase